MLANYKEVSKKIKAREQAFINASGAITTAYAVEATKATKGMETVAILAGMAGVEPGSVGKGETLRKNGEVRYAFICIGAEKGCHVIVADTDGGISFHQAGTEEDDDFMPNLNLEIVLNDDVPTDVAVLLETLFINNVTRADLLAREAKAAEKPVAAVKALHSDKEEDKEKKEAEKPAFMTRLKGGAEYRRPVATPVQMEQGQAAVSVFIDTGADTDLEVKPPATALVISGGKLESGAKAEHPGAQPPADKK